MHLVGVQENKHRPVGVFFDPGYAAVEGLAYEAHRVGGDALESLCLDTAVLGIDFEAAAKSQLGGHEGVFCKGRRAVALVGQQLGQHRDAAVYAQQAGLHGAARVQARQHGGVGIEGSDLGGKAVFDHQALLVEHGFHVGRGVARVAVDRKVVGSQRVERNQHDVGQALAFCCSRGVERLQYRVAEPRRARRRIRPRGHGDKLQGGGVVEIQFDAELVPALAVGGGREGGFKQRSGFTAAGRGYPEGDWRRRAVGRDATGKLELGATAGFELEGSVHGDRGWQRSGFTTQQGPGVAVERTVERGAVCLAQLAQAQRRRPRPGLRSAGGHQQHRYTQQSRHPQILPQEGGRAPLGLKVPGL